MASWGSGAQNQGGHGGHQHPRGGTVPLVASGTRQRGRCPSLHPTQGGCCSRSLWGRWWGGDASCWPTAGVNFGGGGTGGSPSAATPKICHIPPASASPGAGPATAGEENISSCDGAAALVAPEGAGSVRGCPPNPPVAPSSRTQANCGGGGWSLVGGGGGGSARPGAAPLPPQRQEAERRECRRGRLRFKAPPVPPAPSQGLCVSLPLPRPIPGVSPRAP